MHVTSYVTTATCHDNGIRRTIKKNSQMGPLCNKMLPYTSIKYQFLNYFLTSWIALSKFRHNRAALFYDIYKLIKKSLQDFMILPPYFSIVGWVTFVIITLSLFFILQDTWQPSAGLDNLDEFGFSMFSISSTLLRFCSKTEHRPNRTLFMTVQVNICERHFWL